MPIVSLSLTHDLLRKLDRLMREGGYSSRSEAVRDAIRNYLSEYALSREEAGRVAAIVSVISERDRRDVDQRLARLRHEYEGIVSGNMHIHLGPYYCLELFIAEGELGEIMTFVGKVRATRGVSQVKYTMVPIEA